MRISEDLFRQHLLMKAQLRLSIQSAPGVIEINLSFAIEAGIVTVAQFVQIVSFIIGRVFVNKISIFVHGGSWILAIKNFPGRWGLLTYSIIICNFSTGLRLMLVACPISILNNTWFFRLPDSYDKLPI